MYYTIYKITNLINNKIYVGQHKTLNLNDAYMGSGPRIKNAIRKYGKENFNKEILHIFETEEEMNAKEKELVDLKFCLREDTYNIETGNSGGSVGYESFKQKYNVTSPMHLPEGKRKNLETRKKNGFVLPNWNGRKHKPETILKMQEAAKNRSKNLKK